MTWWNEQDWEMLDGFKRTMPAWWLNCEYFNKLDATGGKIFTEVYPLSKFVLPIPSAVDIAPGCVLTFYRPWDFDDKGNLKEGVQPVTKVVNIHWYARAGADWNSSWGHTVVVAITDGTDWFIVDEFRGTNLIRMAMFILKWQKNPFWGATHKIDDTKTRKRFWFAAERQGHLKTTQSRAETLRKNGVIVDQDENMQAYTQISKLTYLEGLNENGCLHWARSCTMCLREGETYRRDEQTSLPAQDQEDHAMDGLIHLAARAAGDKEVKMKMSSNFAWNSNKHKKGKGFYR
jgi:hypothetical protein